MKEWKVGDEIEILRGESGFYEVGAKGILVMYDGQDWYVDFSQSPQELYEQKTGNSWYANVWRFDLSVEDGAYD